MNSKIVFAVSRFVFWATFLAVWIAAAAQADAQAHAQPYAKAADAVDRPTWRVVYTVFPPYTYSDQNGDAAGYGNDLMRALARQEGADITFRKVDNPAQIMRALGDGSADATPNLVMTAQREGQALFTTPHADIVVRAFARAQSARALAQRWPGGLSAAVPEGSYPASVARRIDGLRVLDHASNADAIFAVARGNADVIVFAEAPFLRLLSDLGLERDFVAISDPLSTVPVSIAVTRADPELFAQIDDGLRRFMAREDFVRLNAEAFGVLSENYAPRDVAIMLATAAAAMVAIGGSIMIRQHHVAQAALACASEQRARLEREKNAVLRTKNAHLEARAREIEEFAYVVSHDLSSPLVSISGFCKRARRAVEAEDRARVCQSLDRIDANITGMSALIDGILEVSRVSRIEPRCEPFSTDRLFERLRDTFSEKAFRAGATLRFEGAATLRSDPQLLGRALQNLVENALRHGCPDRGATVTVGAERTDRQVRLWVRDHGPGLQVSNRARLFEMFQRGSDAKDQGAGLGLAIVARIAEQLGATCDLDSAPGQGATFSITLPESAVADDPSATRKAA